MINYLLFNLHSTLIARLKEPFLPLKELYMKIIVENFKQTLFLNIEITVSSNVDFKFIGVEVKMETVNVSPKKYSCRC